MWILRRSLLVASALPILPRRSRAASFPTRPIRILVGAPPGGGNDIMARLVAQKLSTTFGQPLVVENRPGAGATIATDMVAKSAPDGYTLLMTPSAHALAPSIYSNLPYDAVRDFSAVGQIANVPMVLVVPSSSQFRSLGDLVAAARAAPGQRTYASGGAGTSQHLTAALLASLASLNLSHVPYRGSGPAMVDVMGGRVDFMVETVPAAMPHLRNGSIRALAVASARREPVLPDVPTGAEAGQPGFEVVSWYGLLAPAATPPDVVAVLNQALNRVIEMPDTLESLAALGATPQPGPPARFLGLIEAEIARWRPIIQQAGLRLE